MGNLTGSSTAEINAPLDEVWKLVEDVEKADAWARSRATELAIRD